MSNKKNEFYFDLYEKLYQTGYHNNQELSHTKKLFPFLNEVDGGKKNIKGWLFTWVSCPTIKRYGLRCLWC